MKKIIDWSRWTTVPEHEHDPHQSHDVSVKRNRRCCGQRRADHDLEIMFAIHDVHQQPASWEENFHPGSGVEGVLCVLLTILSLLRVGSRNVLRESDLKSQFCLIWMRFAKQVSTCSGKRNGHCPTSTTDLTNHRRRRLTASLAVKETTALENEKHNLHHIHRKPFTNEIMTTESCVFSSMAVI